MFSARQYWRAVFYSCSVSGSSTVIHGFRHSHASVLINEGIFIQEIARQLGRARVETTWEAYAHLYPREEERAISILDRIQ